MVDTSRAPAHADRAKSTSLTVAINSQINPRTAGGVETALNALNAQLGRLDASAKFVLLTLDRYADEIARCAGPNQRVEVWPFGQRGYEPPPTPGRRWLRARQRAGRFAPLVDFACAARHRLARRPPGNPSASQTDPFLRSRGVSVVHFPYGLRFGTSLPFVYEPWDLQHRHHPEFFSRAEWQWREEMYRASCLSATHVVTATRWTKNDIVAQYGLDPEKVVVIPRGPSAMPPRLSRAQQAAARADLDLPDSFAFFPAMTFPHKNHILLLEALAELRDQHGVVLPLLCSGRLYKPHWPKVAAAVERLQLNGQVRFLGPVEDRVLHALFGTASFMVFPSLFEGLGLPLLEAMGAGLPVLASEATCLPEVAGDAAILFDARSRDSIVQALLRVIREPKSFDARLARAEANLQRFTWDAAARTFVATYRAAANHTLTDEEADLFERATQ